MSERDRSRKERQGDRERERPRETQRETWRYIERQKETERDKSAKGDVREPGLLKETTKGKAIRSDYNSPH